MEMKFEDLFVTCPVCKGAGSLTEQKSTGSIIGITGSSTSGPCGECKGNGGKLTPSGDAMARFLAQLRRMGRL